MKELIKEIFSSIKQNKLRTALTGFSVAWGIFMLMILLGSGNGLQNGISTNFAGQNMNTVSIYSSNTQNAYKGHKKGRWISFEIEDAEFLKKNIPKIKRYAVDKYKGGSNVSSGANNITCNSRGINPDYAIVEGMTIERGRNISQVDMDNKRKVALISEYSEDVLFGEDEDAVGQNIILDGVVYRVVGIISTLYQSSYVTIYIPITTQLFLYKELAKSGLNSITLDLDGVETVEQSEALNKEIKDILAERHEFDKNDNGAIYMWSAIKNYMEIQLVFFSIQAFLWIVGLGTLLIGVIGVSNIMIVTVKERTFEFGIRKSMGATPASLIKMVLIESVAITSIFGYIGLLLGTVTMKIVSYVLEASSKVGAEDNPINFETFKDPTVDMTSAIAATIVLIIAGVIAGYVPARRAAKLKTIDAMRYNK